MMALQPRVVVPKLARLLLDFALPPRCGGCGTIVDQIDSFCPDCWQKIEFLGSGGCSTCGLPLQSTEMDTCAACLANPPRLSRTRAAVAYDDISRSIAIRLKYGRKVALARTMARYMTPLLDSSSEDALLVPVPLHRRRLWWRGFNQAAMVAKHISRRSKIPYSLNGLKRVKATPPLKGLGMLQRRRTVSGAFRAHAEVRGRTIILVDDVLTTGSTADACARALKRVGAARVELISWARVIRPAQIM